MISFDIDAAFREASGLIRIIQEHGNEVNVVTI